tara:strand:+ start:13932 stop:15575 length:1644 start_codon:yes stop_codon:yes gene_type:complete
MAIYDKKAYKNPRMPRAGEVTGAGQRATSAPPRAGGMLEMAAQARARQPKRGAPPIPDTKAFRPDQRPSATAPQPRQPQATQSATDMGMQAPPVSVNFYGGQMRDDANARQAAAQNLAGSTLAMGGGGDEKPTPDPTPPGGIPQYGTGLGKDTLPGAGAEALPDVGGTPGEKEESELPPTGPPPGYVASGEDDLAGKKKKFGKSGSEGSQKKKASWVEHQEGLVRQTAEEQDWTPAFDEGGGRIGYYDDQGNFYSNSGNPSDVPDDAVDVETSKKKGLSDAMMKEFYGWLGEQTGIPDDQLEGQIKGLEYAGIEAMAKLSQQMAGRGAGRTGAYEQGAGQIASQVMMGVANLKFENAKLAIDHKLNKMKTFMAFQGQMESEENRMEIFKQMQEWEKEKFQYQKDQDALQNTMTDLNDLAALAQAWDDDALVKAFEMASATDEDGNKLYTAKDIMKYMLIERDVDGVPTISLNKAKLEGEAAGETQEGADATDWTWTNMSDEEKVKVLWKIDKEKAWQWEWVQAWMADKGYNISQAQAEEIADQYGEL